MTFYITKNMYNVGIGVRAKGKQCPVCGKKDPVYWAPSGAKYGIGLAIPDHIVKRYFQLLCIDCYKIIELGE